MTTSPPQVNGHPRTALPVIRDWRTTFNVPPVEEPVVEPEPQPEPAAPQPDLIAEAEADAIRTRSYAEAEEQRVAADAKAKAIVIKAAEEARKLKLANDKAEARAAEEQAARDARIAESNRKREDAERATREAQEADAARQQTEAEAQKEIDAADETWRKYAIRFAIVCGIVALPVQMNAFWNPDSPWLVAAPLMLEGGSWVVQRGAAAAVANRRPLWHYRVIAWLLALIAAGINLGHGWTAFDPFTAMATAFASVAGPGVWDLHEHGRIRKRDGVLSRKERRAARKAAEKRAADQTAREQREAALEEDRQEAMEAAAQQIAEQRADEFPDEWKYALKLAVAMGETAVTDTVWDRAWDDLHAAKPGVTANSIAARNAAAARMVRVLERAPENTPSKVKSSQREIQVKTPAKRSSYRPVPPRRKRGDTAPFHPVARALAADAKRQSNARTEEQK